MINLRNFNKSILLTLTWLMFFTLQASAQTDSVKEQSESVKDIIINKKPLQDFAAAVLDKWERKEIDLTKSFTLELEGTLTKDGRLNKEKARFTKSEGDEDIVNVAKSAIEAVEESGSFIYLSNLGIKVFTLTVSQNETNFSVNIVSNLKSIYEAKTVASGLNTLIKITQMQESKRFGEDEKYLLSNLNSKSEDSKIIINFEIPKSVQQEMINQNLKRASEYRKK